MKKFREFLNEATYYKSPSLTKFQPLTGDFRTDSREFVNPFDFYDMYGEPYQNQRRYEMNFWYTLRAIVELFKNDSKRKEAVEFYKKIAESGRANAESLGEIIEKFVKSPNDLNINAAKSYIPSATYYEIFGVPNDKDNFRDAAFIKTYHNSKLPETQKRKFWDKYFAAQGGAAKAMVNRELAAASNIKPGTSSYDAAYAPEVMASADRMLKNYNRIFGL